MRIPCIPLIRVALAAALAGSLTPSAWATRPTGVEPASPAQGVEPTHLDLPAGRGGNPGRLLSGSAQRRLGIGASRLRDLGRLASLRLLSSAASYFGCFGCLPTPQRAADVATLGGGALYSEEG